MKSVTKDYVVGQWFVSNKFGLCISGRLLWCRKWTVWSWSMASLLDSKSWSLFSMSLCSGRRTYKGVGVVCVACIFLCAYSAQHSRGSAGMLP